MKRADRYRAFGRNDDFDPRETLVNLFDVAKYTRVQVDASFVGPSVTTQGRTDAYWYANIAIRQQLFNRRLTASLVFRDVFRSASYVSDIQTADLRSITRIKPKYPQITLSLSWTFNSFKAKQTERKENRSDKSNSYF